MMIGVIGGSGFYNFLDEFAQKKIDTPFGEVKVDLGKKLDQEVCFIPRHGKSHTLLPNQINYRANIFAAHHLDLDFIITTNAVGSINKEYGPGTLAVLDQIIDFTSGRGSTFFDDPKFSVTTRNGKELSGVVHTDVTYPFDQSLRDRILSKGRELDIELLDGGTIAVFNGPRYETAAEINAVKILGADFAGMTSAPEAFLAKELEIPYASVAVVTNYAAGLQQTVSHSEVTEIFRENIFSIKSLFSSIISTPN